MNNVLPEPCPDTRPSALGVDVPQARQALPEAIAPLHVKLLGGFCVERTDTAQAVSYWPRRPAKTLVKLLAVQPGHVLHREQIIDVLWPGADAESALNSFGKALHAARHALEPGLTRRQDSAYLRLTDAMLALNTEYVVVDADQFEELAGNAIQRGNIDAYEAALAVYGGELLPEDRYEDWCSERREFAAGQYIRLLIGLAEVLHDVGALADASARVRQALSHDPSM
ncbi:MAG: hypothetical protein JO037_05900, partial [Actinobacteria bacterium]|nr:hypothetical protein [Actinomycetota bacterium]